ncbi:MAG TPA: ComEC/Rec2 family competence protein [Pirellulaceae bacterium]|jgi:competence protein ComEC
MAPRYSPLVLLVAAVAGGIATDRICATPTILWWLIGLVAISGWFSLWICRREELASGVLLISAAAVGATWHHANWHVYPANEISRMMQEQSRPCVVEAIAITSPRWVPAPVASALRTIPQGERSEFSVWVTAIRDGQTMRPASGWADLDVNGVIEEIRAGDRIRVFAQGSRAAAPLNPGEFDYANYQRSQRIGCRLFAEFPSCVERLEDGGALNPRRWLADIRSGGLAILRRNIQGERAMLASAVLLGAREQLDPNRNEGYLTTGTIHILSISGVHVGILAILLFGFYYTGLLGRRMTLAAIILVTIAYALLTDMQPPVVRAAILVVVACGALWTGRSAIGFNSLAAAAIVVLALNPASLFLAGPQLSFLAVATMIAFQSWLVPHRIVDPIDRLIATTRPWVVRSIKRFGGGLWRVWLTGALIWLFGSPLVWRQWNLISPVALVLNFLMWLPVTLAMFAGLGTLLAGAIMRPLARLCGWLCDGSFGFLEWLIEMGRDWPGGHFWLPAPPSWWVAIFYICFVAAVSFPALRPSRRRAMAMVLGWTAGALVLSQVSFSAVTPRRERPLVCHFVAVGHGVGVLVEFPDGHNLLYDSGRLGSPLAGVRPISSVLWSRGIRHVDAMVISHADADHFNAIPGLLDRFSIGAVYVSPVMFRRMPAAVKELRDSIERRGVLLREIYAGQRLAAGDDTKIEVLHPTSKGVYGSDNANSIVLLIEYARRRVLLTGDLESPGLDDVLAEEPLDADVVLAPHHGSPRSNPGRFADWCRPEHVVISGSKPLGDEAVIESVKDSFRLRGAEVYHTAEDGCVRVEIGPKEIAIQTTRPHVRAASSAAKPNAKFLQPD